MASWRVQWLGFGPRLSDRPTPLGSFGRHLVRTINTPIEAVPVTPSVVSKGDCALAIFIAGVRGRPAAGGGGRAHLAGRAHGVGRRPGPRQQGGRDSWSPAASQRQLETIRKAGLVAIEVEPTEVAISERISLALIEAVANDILQAGARVVVVYSGFEAEALDSLSVIRLGEHLERLTARDLRALETSVPFETLKAVVDVAIEIGREGREGKAVGTLIVVGDARNVMTRTRQLGFDPFKGYLSQGTKCP